jgi:parallel beta-helix repeat protein
MVCIEKNGQTEKSIKRRMCRFDMLIGTFLTFFVIACFVLLLWIGYVSAATIVVNQTSPACTTGDEYCNTIQEALYMAEEGDTIIGDTIIVCPCIYKENIVVDTSVCIQSYAGASDTVIEAKDNRKNIVIIKANKVTISGFTIRNSNAEGIYLRQANGCNISANDIHSVRNGIHLYSSSNNKISRNTINLNDNKGIYMEYSHNNSILNNTANANKQSDGIDLSSSNNNIIIGNNASNNMEDGIYLHYSNNNILRGNIANSNKQYRGIDLSTSTNNLIEDNNASNNFQSGIALFESSNNNTIMGNTANLNNNDGIYLENSHINSILNNTANSNKGSDGIDLNSADNNIIMGNNASNNMEVHPITCKQV